MDDLIFHTDNELVLANGNERERPSGELRAFEKIAERCQCKPAEHQVLLANMPSTTYYRIRQTSSGVKPFVTFNLRRWSKHR